MKIDHTPPCNCKTLIVAVNNLFEQNARDQEQYDLIRQIVVDTITTCPTHMGIDPKRVWTVLGGYDGKIRTV